MISVERILKIMGDSMLTNNDTMLDTKMVISSTHDLSIEMNSALTESVPQGNGGGKEQGSDNTSTASGVSETGSNNSSVASSRNKTASESVPLSQDCIWREVKVETDSGHEEAPPKLDTRRSGSRRLSWLLRRNSSKSEDELSPVEVPRKPKVNLEDVRVDELPQVLLTKYLGSRECDGLFGTQITRDQVENMIDAVKKVKKGVELSLYQLQISTKGIVFVSHEKNKGKTIPKEKIPIDFISYGVQDVKFTRIFSFIIVREISSKERKTECHAHICDSEVTARKMALSLALSFKKYAKSFEEAPHRFEVELNPPKTPDKEDELEQEKEPPGSVKDFEA